MTVDFLSDASVLVTGGTGSFGSAFVRTLLEQSAARRIIIFSRDELKQAHMQASLDDPEKRLRFFIGDIRDAQRLFRAFKGVDYVVHAAALKQVSLMEYNPFEAVKTNILGTQNIIDAALDQGVQKVLLVSTDKAANPANLYGATKLCAEKLIVNANAYSGYEGTMFAAVRYGNVLGSRGSIVEVVRQQRAKGHVLLTHTEMTRFWITLRQSVKFVLESLRDMLGGEIFIPKIPSMRIQDLLTALAPECEIRVSGIRPGEKLHEILISPQEARNVMELDGRYVILPEYEWMGASSVVEQYKQIGCPVGEQFTFSSNLNDDWMDTKRLTDLLADSV